jgi:hypothetical protein
VSLAPRQNLNGLPCRVVAGTMTSEMTFLCARPHPLTSPLHQSDQITVPQAVWSTFDHDHHGSGPIFVMLDSHCLGRLRPATTEDGVGGDSMCVPEWMWVHLGGGPTAEEQETGLWFTVTRAAPHYVKKLTLRPHQHASLMSLENPVATLGSQIMGAGHGGWVSLTDGITLDLPCGRFDVLGLTDADGEELYSGCIMDVDIDLDLRPALDYVEPPPVRLPPSTCCDPPTPQKTTGFVPFSGAGYRLGRS